MSGWKDWQIGEVVTEGDFQSLVQDQVVQRYADASERTSTLGTAVAEGMVSYLDSDNSLTVFDGASWIPVGEGDITAVTAGTGLSGGGTAGDVTLSADYAAIGSAITIETSQVSDLTATASELNILDGATVTAAALNTIDDGTQGFTALSNGTAGITYQPVSHNYIINGAFDVWQRGTSVSVSSEISYQADRFAVGGIGNTAVYSQQTFTPAELLSTGFGDAQFYSRVDNTSVAGASNYTQFLQRVEDVRTLAGQTVTFSYYAKADAAKSVVVELQQLFGSGGSASVNTFIAKPALTTSWARYSHTFTVPSTSGKTIGTGSYADFRFWLDAGSNFDARTDSLGHQDITFDIWGVQLEAGSVATPFKRHAPDVGLEELACKRYYQVLTKGNSGAVLGMAAAETTSSIVGTIALPVPMRVSPTLVCTTGTNFYRVRGINNFVDDISGTGITKQCLGFFNNTDISGATVGQSGRFTTENTAAFIAADAEL